jgi:TolB-like protein
MNPFKMTMFAMGLAGLASVSAFADGPPVPAPVTPPAAVARVAPRVEIFAFSSVASQPGQTDWIGRGLQESLQSEVAHTGATLMIPVHAPAATDDAITVARQNKADLAVIGTYQVVGDDVRVNGHLVDVASNNTVGSFAATGPQKSLFAIEDAVGEQLRRSLPAAPMAQQAAAAQQQAAQQQVAQQQAAQQPTVIYQQDPSQAYAPPPAVNNYYDATPDYGYYYPDTYYDGYGYPFGFYGGLGFYGGGFGRGFDRGGFGRGGFIGHGGGFVGHGGGFAGHGGGIGGGHGGFGGGGHGGGGHR